MAVSRVPSTATRARGGSSGNRHGSAKYPAAPTIPGNGSDCACIPRHSTTRGASTAEPPAHSTRCAVPAPGTTRTASARTTSTSTPAVRARSTAASNMSAT
ncbi:Uncharacterised protein [Mycobacteroides abscessus subsp. abscessus]|nr:Uncharacterised protein [Mycobacteroides abscessus subsp. abscessus]